MFSVLVLCFFIEVIFKITFKFSFSINLKSAHLAVQFTFIFMVFDRCKKRVNILLSLFLSVGCYIKPE
ncbi:hypothetical protein Hanom_Chr00s063147g01785971 [Helianthus anomalus]